MLRRTYSRQTSPVSAPPPIRYSSNLELCHSGSAAAAVDRDWMDGQLERARLQRAPFYRRLTTARRRWDNHHHQDDDDDASALHKFRKSPETEAVTPPPPHSSWRFYTSFDNGEWNRHAVPVLKAEEEEEEGVVDQTGGEVNGPARFGRHGVARSEGCSAAEIGLRKGRQSRSTTTTTAAAGEGDSLSDRLRRRVLSCSMESFRGIVASGAVCLDSPGGSDYFARDTGRRSLSPRSQPFASSGGGDVSIFDDDVTCDDVMRDDDSPRKQRLPFVLTGSVKINGVEARLEDKIIVPTKYKNTATGIPEIKISTETRNRTSGDDDVISRKFGRRSVTARRSKAKADEDRGEAIGEATKGQRPNCTTGMGEDRPLKASTELSENGSLEKNRQNERVSNSAKEISIRNKEQNKNSRLIVSRRSEAVRMRQDQQQQQQKRANGKRDGLENGLAPEKETRAEIRESQDKINHSTALGTLSPPAAAAAAAAAAKDKVTEADDKINQADDGCRSNRLFSREMDCGTVVESTTVPFESRDGEIQVQNQELTSKASNVNATEVASSENERATPRFISLCFVSINSGQKTTAEMKSTAKEAGTGRNEVVSKAETKDLSNDKIPKTSEDSEWTVEMAVRD